MDRSSSVWLITTGRTTPNQRYLGSTPNLSTDISQQGGSMLVITRKSGESIQIGDIRIVLLKTSGNKVRVGIDAPRGVVVTRPERRVA